MRNPNLRFEYKVDVDPATFPPGIDTLDGVTEDIDALRFTRIKNSHRGVARLKRLGRLMAFCVNQDFLEEISALPMLESLYIYNLTATDLHCFGQCHNLRHLVINGGTKIPNLSWLSALPNLNSLLLENAKHVKDLSELQTVPHLTAFGIEGSMTTVQRVNTFQPIAELPHLQALFLYACQPAADGIRPLFGMRQLRHLEIAGRYPDRDFIALRKAVPELTCSWFQEIDRYGSIKASIKARVKEMTNSSGKRGIENSNDVPAPPSAPSATRRRRGD